MIMNLVEIGLRADQAQVNASEWPEARASFELVRGLAARIEYPRQASAMLDDLVGGEGAFIQAEFDEEPEKARSDLAALRTVIPSIVDPDHRTLALIRIAEAENYLGDEKASHRFF